MRRPTKVDLEFTFILMLMLAPVAYLLVRGLTAAF